MHVDVLLIRAAMQLAHEYLGGSDIYVCMHGLTPRQLGIYTGRLASPISYTSLGLVFVYKIP